MVRTEYSVLTDEELLQHVAFKDKPSHLEIELAQRLAIALDLLAEHGLDSRG
jgi:hypothetical protein